MAPMALMVALDPVEVVTRLVLLLAVALVLVV
jgi:hypothetical protein